jgi:predicted nucleic acid-binding Zn ribbon protein
MKRRRKNTKFQIFITSILLLLLTLATTTSARKPAIEPIMGISIDDNPPANPEKNPGFKFESNTKKAATAPKTTTAPAPQAKALPEVTSEKETTSIASYIFMVFVIALPIVVWFSMMSNLHKGPSEDAEVTKLKQKKEDDHDDDYQIPKAS